MVTLVGSLQLEQLLARSAGTCNNAISRLSITKAKWAPCEGIGCSPWGFLSWGRFRCWEQCGLLVLQPTEHFRLLSSCRLLCDWITSGRLNWTEHHFASEQGSGQAGDGRDPQPQQAFYRQDGPSDFTSAAEQHEIAGFVGDLAQMVVMTTSTCLAHHCHRMLSYSWSFLSLCRADEVAWGAVIFPLLQMKKLRPGHESVKPRATCEITAGGQWGLTCWEQL